MVSRLERLLGTDCRALGRDETDMVLLALRALGNAGVVITPATLARCYEVSAAAAAPNYSPAPMSRHVH